MGRAYNMNGRENEFIQGLVGNPEGNVPLGIRRRGWENKIKMDLRETG
jgi:hypothetical protein